MEKLKKLIRLTVSFQGAIFGYLFVAMIALFTTADVNFWATAVIILGLIVVILKLLENNLIIKLEEQEKDKDNK